ncbi:MAG: hypothetical protein RMK00_08795, partial [Bacteroidota bacterium]|nr:hypothetical protein [Bacteroidota bacterium]
YGPEILKFFFVQAQAFSKAAKAELLNRFEKLKKRDVLPVFRELFEPDRRALDDVVFDVLGLTQGEREAVYEAVVALVRARLEKARSV